MSLFSISNLTYAYPGRPPCLQDVTFTIVPGERVALLGANGSGKSTLLRLLDGLYYATTGSVAVMEHTLSEEALERTAFGARFRKEVGFLFQSADAQLFCPTVEEELAFGPLQLGWVKEEIHQRIDDTLALLDIARLRDRAPHTLSGGEQKRVALGSLLVMSPSVLLLDEPTAGLDPRSQGLLLEVLEDLHQTGLTLVTATHDLTLVPHLADRALVISEDHRLVADAPTGEVLHNTDLLLAVNLIHAHTHRHGDTLHTHPHHHILAHDHAH